MQYSEPGVHFPHYAALHTGHMLFLTCPDGASASLIIAPPLIRGGRVELLALHRLEEFVVGFEILQLVEQEFSGWHIFHIV